MTEPEIEPDVVQQVPEEPKTPTEVIFVKKTLQERLTDLIDSNIKLEHKSKLAEHALEVLRTEYDGQINKIKCFYEAEMCEARRLLNQEAESCASLTLRVNDGTKLTEELTAENEHKTAFIAKFKTDIEKNLVESQNLKIENEQLKRHNISMKIDVDRWEEEATISQNKCKNLQMSLDEQILKRVNAENQMQGLIEKNVMNEQLFQNLVSIREETKSKEVKAEVQENQLSLIAEEYAALYEHQVSVFEAEAKKIKEGFQNEKSKMSSELKILTGKLSRKNAEYTVLEKQAKETELLHKEREESLSKSEETSLISAEKLRSDNLILTEEISELKKQIYELVQQNGQNSEIEIKKELNTFESLLQCEETRLGLNTNRKRKIEKVEKSVDEDEKKKDCIIM